MRVETELTLFTALFVAGLGALYWFTSYEHAGTTLLVIGGIAYAMMCGYLLIQAVRLHRSGTSRPEDREQGQPAEGAGEVGYFPAATVWPAAIGLGAVLVGLGLVFGFWFIVIGAIVLAGAVIGYAVEAQARP
jgi:hypothetical protein